MQKNGPRLTETLNALNLEGTEREDTERNAANIVAAIIVAFGMRPDGSIEDETIYVADCWVQQRNPKREDTGHDRQYGDGVRQ